MFCDRVRMGFWVVFLVVASIACGSDEKKAPQASDDKVPAYAVGQQPNTAQLKGAGATLTRPDTEDAVVKAVARAIASQDIRRLRQLVSPELGADLARLHHNDPERFWNRGQRLVKNVESGFTICHRQEQTGRVLLCFGNGKKERVKFTRLEGRWVLEEL